MADKVNPLRVVQNVLQQAQKNKGARHERVESAGLSPQLACLREFQARRIAQTYHDFIAQPRYAPVMKFFLEDLYAARDFTQRDHDVERAHNFLSKVVPADMLKLATDAIELTQLSHTLDEALLRVLVKQLHFQDTLTPELYAEAYRRCNNCAARRHQIELLVNVMRDAAEAARFPLSGAALRMVKGPAHATGWHEMYAFLERGHHAFRKVKDPKDFLQAIQERETKIMEQIAAASATPFEIQDGQTNV